MDCNYCKHKLQFGERMFSLSNTVVPGSEHDIDVDVKPLRFCSATCLTESVTRHLRESFVGDCYAHCRE